VSAGIILGLSMGLRQSFGLFLAPMTQALHIGRGDFALTVAIQNLLWGVTTPFVGALADRYGTGRFLAAGGLVYAAGLFVMAYGDSLLWLHVGSGILVGLGVSAAGFSLALAAVARSVPPEKRSLMLGLASAGGSAGQFLLLPGSQGLIDAFGWQNALLVLGLLALLILPLSTVLVGKPRAVAGHQQSLGQALREAFGHSGFRLLTLGFFVCGFHVAFVATHLPGYIVTCNLDPLVGATALGIIGFFNIIGGLLAGWLGGRYPKKYLLSSIYLGRAIIIALFLLGPKTEWTVWIFSAVFGFLWLSTVPLTSGLVAEIFGPRYMATLVSIVMLGHQIGAFFGAWLGGETYDATGSYDLVWYMAIGLGVFAAIVHLPIRDKSLRAPAAA
jgi:predicted MFS family arabinose efflux permease